MGFALSKKHLSALGRARLERGQQPLFPMPADAPALRVAPRSDRNSASGGAAAAGARVLSCDPSSQKFGWAVVESPATGRIVRVASGRFTPRKAKAASDQYTQIVENLNGVIDRYAVGMVLFEVHSGNVGYRMRGMSAAAYGRAVEIPHTIAVVRGLAWRAIDVATWKGSTSKGYTAGLVRRLLGYEARWEDESDAVGLACWWLMQGRAA